LPGGLPFDAGPLLDAGLPFGAAPPFDGGPLFDGGLPFEAAPPFDGGPLLDAGLPFDGGFRSRGPDDDVMRCILADRDHSAAGRVTRK
jgi:hypothetical protein